jgi:two-component system, OmpR family, sensor histidine kinase TctE
MITPHDLLVEGDNAALQQLLNILLDNAVKYTPEPGRIHLSVEERGGNAVLRAETIPVGSS